MILAWARLIRLSNLPSAASNVLAGYLLVAAVWEPLWGVIVAISASLMFYAGGVIGNDLHDRIPDAKTRPERPLPSGLISASTATIAMYALLTAGLVLCSVLEGESEFWNPKSGRILAVGVLLVASIVAYNFLLKRWLVSAVAMGLCRGLNLLLGATVANHFSGFPDGQFLPLYVWLAVASITCFVTGLTLLARDEASATPRRWLLNLAAVIMLAGLAGYAMVGPVMERFQDATSANVRMHLILVSVIGFTVMRRAIVACLMPDKRSIRAAVITALFSLVTLDAAIAMLASGGHPVYALVILGLLGLGMLFSRFTSPT